MYVLDASKYALLFFYLWSVWNTFSGWLRLVTIARLYFILFIKLLWHHRRDSSRTQTAINKYIIYYLQKLHCANYLPRDRQSNCHHPTNHIASTLRCVCWFDDCLARNQRSASPLASSSSGDQNDPSNYIITYIASRSQKANMLFVPPHQMSCRTSSNALALSIKVYVWSGWEKRWRDEGTGVIA